MKRLRMAKKLALAIIPIGLVALAAGALVAKNALDRAYGEETASTAAQVAADAMDSLVAFSEEHALALDIAFEGSEGNLEGRQTATDNALDQLSESVRVLTPRASGSSASGIVASIAGDSSRVRSLIDQLRQIDPTSAESAELVTDVGDRLISVVTQSTFYFGDESRAREGEGAVALARASFASFQQELLVIQNEFGESLEEDVFLQQMVVLESTVEDWISTAASSSPTVEARGFTRTQSLSDDNGFTPETFLVDRNAVLADTASEILVRVSDSAQAFAAEARAQAGTVAVIVIAALALAAIVALIVGRSTTKRVRSITAAAQHVAEVDLPRMVDSLSNPSGVLEATTPMEVDKTGADEVGDLARSFSTLHITLVDVANQQMDSLRKGVSDIFVTLARRNRSLVDRQLALVDELEAREEDPEVLEGYYKLDHLATRMRRNAESLLVLAGAESPRMWTEPVEMGEVVRAALGEVDEYRRIDVLAMEPSLLVGRAVSDLSHLLSELLDNATQFSPPTEKVRVTGLFDDDGYVVTVADSGVGMSQDRMVELNHLMENPPVLGLALEPTLGIYVVARLADRHGIKVKLVPGVPGTTVRVTVPRELLGTGREDSPTPPAQEVLVSADEPTSASSLPAVVVPQFASFLEETPAAGGPAQNGHSSEAKDDAEPSAPSRPEPRLTSPAATNGAGPVGQRAAEEGRHQAPDEGEDVDGITPSNSADLSLEREPSATTGSHTDDAGESPHKPNATEQPESPDPSVPTDEKPSPDVSSDGHLSSPPSKPVAKRPESVSEPERASAGNGSLPTRRPGASFRETNEFAASSTSSHSGAAGIRSALDGYSKGREIATTGNGERPSDDSNDESGDES